jgi:predicted dehydrogenase
MVRVGVIGYGYWGPNMVRNFSEAPGCEVAAVSDLSEDRLAAVRRRYPAVRTSTDFHSLLADASIDAIVIATPVSSHFPLAMEALQAGKHVLVEKPMTSTSEDSRRLIAEAERRKKVLFVDHTFVYTGAVRKIHDLIEAGDLGDIYYFDSTRVNLGLFQHDVNVIWDLAVHDLSIMGYVLPEAPVAVSATAISHVKGQPENIAYITLFFKSSLIAHFHVNWLAPVKIRQTLIGGSKKMIVYDDIELSEKVKVYDKGVALNTDPQKVHEMRIGYRAGDMWAPQINISEALQTETRHFIQCVEKGEQPLTDGQAGLRVVQCLEAATASAKERGRLVELQ